MAEEQGIKIDMNHYIELKESASVNQLKILLLIIIQFLETNSKSRRKVYSQIIYC